MHEMSYIVRMVDSALESLREQEISRVEELRIRVGAMTGLEPYYLKKYYPEACRGTILEGSDLHVDMVPVEAYCQECGQLYQPSREYDYACPFCGSGQAKVTHGREFLLDQILVEVEE